MSHRKKFASESFKALVEKFSPKKPSVPVNEMKLPTPKSTKSKILTSIGANVDETYLAVTSGFNILVRPTPKKGYTQQEVEQEATEHSYKVENRKALADALMELKLETQEAIDTRSAILKTNKELDVRNRELPEKTIGVFVDQCKEVEKAAHTPEIYAVIKKTHAKIATAFMEGGSVSGYVLHNYSARLFALYREVLEQPSIEDAHHVDAINEAGKKAIKNQK